MQVTWWMPGMLRPTLAPILVPLRRRFRRGFVLRAGPDFPGHRLLHLLLQVGHKPNRARHHGQAAANPPRDLHLTGDRGDGAGGIDRQLAPVDGARLLRDELHQPDVTAREAVLGRQREEPGSPGIASSVDGVTDSRDRLLAGAESGDDLARNRTPVAPPRRFLEEARRLLDRAAKAVAHAQQAGG